MEPREILIYYALKHEGEWKKIYSAIRNHEEVEDDYKERIGLIKSKVVTIFDEDYPKYLKDITNPPFVLFYYGDLSLISDMNHNLTVVGSRDYSEYGKEKTIEFVNELSENYNIVSGLAKGIDAIAHQSAIESGGKTVAVLGSGIDNCYPFENIELYREIKNNHLLISEYPDMVEPKAEHFPTRNRLVAAFSKGILVTEAYEKSGTLITVRLGLAMSREIMCIPYPANINSYCNRLIFDGSYMADSPLDVISIVGKGKK